ncbi:MAG: dockerin type I domain-containing protein, partial [Candidatus Zixiibacteriota bacterium]
GFIYSDSLSLTTPFLVQGQRYYWHVKTIDSAGFYTNYSTGSNFLYRTYVCGDVNNSGSVPDLSDLSALVSYLTVGSPTPPILQAASVNCNGTIDLSDLSVMVAYLTGAGVTLCCQ